LTLRTADIRQEARVIVRSPLAIKPYLGSLAAALGALAIALLIDRFLDAHNPSRVFLVAVLISAIAYGLWPAVFASLISAAAYDYFFLPPVYTLSIATTEGVIDFGFFVLIALIVSVLAARVRRYAVAADARALTAETLYAFTHHLAAASTVQAVVSGGAEQMSALLGVPVALVLAEGDCPVVNAACPAHVAPDIDCLRTAMGWWALRPEETDDQGFIIGQWRFRTLRGAGDALGLVAIRLQRESEAARAAADGLLRALAYQTGLAIDRSMLRDRVEQSRVHAETERLRSTVLTSISHDLRNPLASITASASVLDRQWNTLGETSKLLMARTIRNEAERLDDFIDKLIDLTSIESEVIRPNCHPVVVLDLVETMLQRASSTIADHCVAIDAPSDLPPIQSDPVLLQQVLYNLVENAAKYAPPGSLIRIVAREHGQTVSISVLDEGAGIPDDDLGRIFDKFYRARAVQGQVTGTGLGLAICRGFLEILDGTIEAANRDDRSGAVFKIILPTATHCELGEVES
jgi:two-component system, OmpR family, sensor histidine kinase KdpD